MDIGHRIKTARLEAGLSQRQLCADVVTRNMLSLIESGKARPSMDTLRHFARTLDKPLSWFLEEDTVTSPNQAVMESCEKAYGLGEYAAVLSQLELYRAPDPVFDNTRYLLEVLACEALAKQAVDQGKKQYALQLLDRADEAAGKTAYAPDASHRTLLRWQAEPQSAKTARLPITESLMLHAHKALQENDPARAAALLDVAISTPPQWHLLRGIAALQLADGAQAVRHLHAAEAAYPAETAPLLEQAYLSLGDYRHAYEYAKRTT